MTYDLRKINIWGHQWKMSFNIDISKQAREVACSRKNFKIPHPSLTFSNIPVAQVGSLKHLRILLDNKLHFGAQLCNIQSKVNEIILIIRNLQNVLPRSPLLTIYKSLACPHLDYGDIIHDNTYNESFK